MRAARVLAQAKINLYLKVFARDGSGYHEIATHFQRLDLADEIIVRATDAPARALDLSGPRLPFGGLGPVERNLAFRAAEAYHEWAGWPRGFSIELRKNIPVGGGLGGGSADAGGVLRTLDKLAPKRLDPGTFRELAASLGADVPFLASELAAASGSGRGDKLVPADSSAPAAVLLLVPPFGISTADAYGWLDAERETPRVPSSLEESGGEPLEHSSSPWARFAVGPFSGNDFEPVVEKRHPVLREFRRRLVEQGARIARLAGSGSTVFGIFDRRAPAAGDLGLDTLVIPTRTSARVVQVEVLE